MSALRADDMSTSPQIRAGSSALGATAATWTVDPSESRACFEAATLWGRADVEGKLGEVSGALQWDGTRGHGRMAIATGGLSTGIGLRDQHLRSREFFHVARHPEVVFDASEISEDGGRLKLGGQLLVRGRAHAFGCTAGVTSLAEDRIALEAAATFDLGELGMSRGFMGMIPPGVDVHVRAVLQRGPRT
jgi:polyisoprenoid-binding protein YceI